LTSVTLPSKITEIPDYAFVSCSSLTEINIPDGVVSIGSNAFDGCATMRTISIPESVVSIGDHAFAGCKNLISAKFENPVGWKGFATNGLIDVNISSNELSDLNTAAFYLWSRYSTRNWEREE
jgi:hypothetical protein